MKSTVSSSDFHHAFGNIRPDNFTYDGLDALFKHLEQYEDGTGDELELDVIAFCCEFTEYENLEEYNQNYRFHAKTIKDIEQCTTVIPVDDERFIIRDY